MKKRYMGRYLAPILKKKHPVARRRSELFRAYTVEFQGHHT